MPTVAPSGAGDQPAVARNDGGTLIKGGGLTSESPMTKSFTEADLADDFGQPYGSKVIAKAGAAGDGEAFTDRVGISGAVPGAIVEGVTQLGYQADGTEWVVQGGNVTQTLAGNAYTGLVGGAAGPASSDGINELESTRLLGKVDVDVLARPASGYNSFVTKSDGPGGPGGTLANYVRPSGAGDEASNDDEANTTRALPGELTYMFGGKLPKSDNYKARDQRES